MATFGPIILIILKFLYPHQKTTQATQSHCFIGRAWHQMDRKGQQLTQNDQNCIFRAKFGRFLDKNSNFYGRNSKFRYSHNRKPPRHLVHISFWSGPKWAKNAIFGPNLAVFGPKILIFTEGSKSIGTHITEYHLGTLFVRAPFLGPKSIFWGEGVKHLVFSYQGTNDEPLSC